jgi:preprotein translocase subunit SecE
MAKAKRKTTTKSQVERAQEANSSWTRFFKETKMEMKKVIWPEKKDMVHYTIATIASVVLVSFLIVAVDFVFNGLSRLLVTAVG